MPKVRKTPDFLQRLAVLEDEVATLRRAGRIRDELPFFPTSFNGIVFDSSASFITLWETTLSPRTATLALGLVLIGNQVSGTNTGGAWQVLLNGTVAGSGSVPATFSYSFAALTLDLTPYRTANQLKVEVQVRRTSGSSTGSIGASPRYAQLL